VNVAHCCPFRANRFSGHDQLFTNCRKVLNIVIFITYPVCFSICPDLMETHSSSCSSLAIIYVCIHIYMNTYSPYFDNEDGDSRYLRNVLVAVRITRCNPKYCHFHNTPSVLVYALTWWRPTRPLVVVFDHNICMYTYIHEHILTILRQWRWRQQVPSKRPCRCSHNTVQS
jgi:hypothetical protein